MKILALIFWLVISALIAVVPAAVFLVAEMVVVWVLHKALGRAPAEGMLSLRVLIPLVLAVVVWAALTVMLATARRWNSRYESLLIFKYLRRRRIAWVSLIAVMLCTAMVLVVISVMGGWIRTFRETFHGLSGDVIVRSESYLGFPHYEEMIEAIKAQVPEVKAASPVVRIIGLININNRRRDGVEVVGYRPDITQVNKFTRSLFLQGREGGSEMSFKLHPGVDYGRFLPSSYPGDRAVANRWSGLIVGSGVVGLDRTSKAEERDNKGLYRAWVRLTLLPLDPEMSGVDLTQMAEGVHWIVDDSRTGAHLIDSKTVYMDFNELQRLLQMDHDAEDDPPARAHEIQIALREGADAKLARNRIEQVVKAISEARGLDYRYPYKVETWERRYDVFIGAVEREKVLVTVLFSLISVVAVFLIFCIFYMIVMEKIRDIGIIKSVGATSGSIAVVFLAYGAAIGVVGSGLGFLVGWAIVHNINWLHDQMAHYMGLEMWTAETYLFDYIPNTMEPTEVAVILAVAVLSSILGALVPAIRAARMHPVEALRWE